MKKPEPKSWPFRRSGLLKPVVLITAGVGMFGGLGIVAGAIQSKGPSVAEAGAQPGSVLFDQKTVHEIHIEVTPEDWAKMEPQGGSGRRQMGGGGGGPGGEIMGPPGDGGGMGRRGVAGVRGGPGGGMPAAAMAAALIQKFDRNGDGVLFRDEWVKIGETWYSEWNRKNGEAVDLEDVSAGLGSLLPMPGVGPGGMPGPQQMGRREGQSMGGNTGAAAMDEDGKALRRNGMSAMSGAEFEYVPARMVFDGAEYAKVAIRYKGNNTFMAARNTVKRSLKIDINRYVSGQKLAGVATLNLHNNINDAGYMNEPLSYRLFRDGGVPSPRTSYARVYVTVQGLHEKRYFGLYSIVENPDNNFAVDRFGSKKGAIFKPSGRRLFEYLGEDWARYAQMYDAKTSLSREEMQRVIDFGKLVTQASDEEFAVRVGEYLDLDEFARFMAVTVWLSNMDSVLSMGQNYVVYLHPKTHQFQFFPWDLDHSFGQFPMAGSREQLINLSLLKPWSGENRFLERVYKLSAFQKLYLGRLREFSETICKPERIQAQVDEMAVVLRDAVREEGQEKLARFEKIVAGESVGGGGFGPGGSGHGGPGGEMVPPIKGFVALRNAAVVAQLEGKAQGATSTRGGPGGGPGGGRGMGGRGGPGVMLAQAVMKAFDVDGDEKLSREEVVSGMVELCEEWSTSAKGNLNAENLAAGLMKDLLPSRMGGPGGTGMGPPPGAFPGGGLGEPPNPFPAPDGPES